MLKHENASLAADNNQLHLQVIKETEHSDARERQHYLQLKAMEDRIAELAFWKHRTLEGFQALEKDNEGLKKRLQELLDEDASGAHCGSHLPIYKRS